MLAAPGPGPPMPVICPKIPHPDVHRNVIILTAISEFLFWYQYPLSIPLVRPLYGLVIQYFSRLPHFQQVYTKSPICPCFLVFLEYISFTLGVICLNIWITSSV